jgi:hypothetical protein
VPPQPASVFHTPPVCALTLSSPAFSAAPLVSPLPGLPLSGSAVDANPFGLLDQPTTTPTRNHSFAASASTTSCHSAATNPFDLLDFTQKVAHSLLFTTPELHQADTSVCPGDHFSASPSEQQPFRRHYEQPLAHCFVFGSNTTAAAAAAAIHF